VCRRPLARHQPLFRHRDPADLRTRERRLMTRVSPSRASSQPPRSPRSRASSRLLFEPPRRHAQPATRTACLCTRDLPDEERGIARRPRKPSTLASRRCPSQARRPTYVPTRATARSRQATRVSRPARSPGPRQV
jgi:hypothetical protein